MGRKKNGFKILFKKPGVLLIIGLAIISVFWLSFTSITTQTSTNSRAAEPTTGIQYTGGQIIFGVQDGYNPTRNTIRSVTGYSDATIEKLYNNTFLLKSTKLRRQYNNLSSSARSQYTSTSPDSFTRQVISSLKSQSYITDAVVDGIVKPEIQPNDTFFFTQWALRHIEAPAAWDMRGSNEVIVGVLDTGIEANHPDITNVMWRNNAEINGSAGVDDDNNGVVDDDYGYPVGSRTTFDTHPGSHGTHVAGILAAQWNNNVGIAGMCPNCKIMTLKWSDDNGNGNQSSVLKAMAYAIKQKGSGVNLKIINHSYVTGGNDFLDEIFLTASRMGIISVAAAGNGNSLMAGVYPAENTATDIVFSVIATEYSDKKANFSNYGTTDQYVDFAAPGYDIKSLKKNGYIENGGTSMAAPHVSGLIGLMMSVKPNLTYQEIKTILKDTAKNIDSLNSPTYAGKLGFGRINARAAMERVMQMVTTPTPNPRITLRTTSPRVGFVYSTPMTIGITGTISGAANNISYIEAKVYKYPVTASAITSQRVQNIVNSTFSSIFSTGISTRGEYLLELIPYNGASVPIGDPHTVRILLNSTTPTATRTPTPTPRSGSIITPTGSLDF